MGEAGGTLAQAVEKTIQEWLAANGGGMVNGFAIIVDYFDAEGSAAWATAHNETATYSQTLGLLNFHTLTIEHAASHYICDGDD